MSTEKLTSFTNPGVDYDAVCYALPLNVERETKINEYS